MRLSSSNQSKQIKSRRYYASAIQWNNGTLIEVSMTYLNGKEIHQKIIIKMKLSLANAGMIVLLLFG